MKKLLLLFLLCFAAQAFGQQPDRWHNLVIDETTPDAAIAILGQPKSDKSERLFIMEPKWLTKDASKSMRILKYEEVEGFSHVRLGFNADSKLVLIHLQPKKITAQAFASSYESLSFRFANEVVSPNDLTEPRNNLEKPIHLEAWYVLVAATKKVFVFGGVGNAVGSVGDSMFGSAARRQSARSMPGNVKEIQLVSRTLENHDGTNLLK